MSSVFNCLRSKSTPFRRTACVAPCLFFGLMALPFCNALAQTIYRSVDANGRVSFSDKPPMTAQKIQSINPLQITVFGDGPTLPVELRQAVGQYPVTLYSSNDCPPCDAGRRWLQGRGIPFVEKTVNSNEDVQALQNLFGSLSLPLLTVGQQQIKGYSESEWAQYTDAAGYPEQNKLPQGYRNSFPAPLVSLKKPTPAASAPEAAPTPAFKPPSVNKDNPAGIMF